MPYSSRRDRVWTISVRRFWISEGLTQNLGFMGWNSQAHRELPGNVESSNLSRDNLSREIGRSLLIFSIPPTEAVTVARPQAVGNRSYAVGVCVALPNQGVFVFGDTSFRREQPGDDACL